MVEEGLSRSFALEAIDAQISAQERSLTATTRAFWVPRIFLQGDVSQIVLRNGTGAENVSPTLPAPLDSIMFPTPNNNNWSIALGASIPLFSGAERYADMRKAEHQLGRDCAEHEHRRAPHCRGEDRVGEDARVVRSADPARLTADQLGVGEAEHDVVDERKDVEGDEENERRADEGRLQPARAGARTGDFWRDSRLRG